MQCLRDCWRRWRKGTRHNNYDSDSDDDYGREDEEAVLLPDDWEERDEEARIQITEVQPKNRRTTSIEESVQLTASHESNGYQNRSSPARERMQSPANRNTPRPPSNPPPEDIADEYPKSYQHQSWSQPKPYEATSQYNDHSLIDPMDPVEPIESFEDFDFESERYDYSMDEQKKLSHEEIEKFTESLYE
eukprot:GILK01004228.1.p1 GENE.GILK01004228.1~~GILK01004228.1.p1  ORF type:complete len:190 (-),score=20.31 GILK01004228.1:277-846(-)